MLIVTCSTEAVSFTESSATVNAERIVASSTEAMSFAENAATVSDFFTATGSLSLSGLSAIDGTGITTHEYLHETATVSDLFNSIFDWDLHETAVGGDVLIGIDVQALHDTANASDTQVEKRIASLHETAYGTDAEDIIWIANLWDVTQLRDRDVLTPFLSESLHETATATDSQTTYRINSLHETATAGEVLEGSATSNEYLENAAEASDDIFALGYGKSLTDNTAVASDVLTDAVIPSETLVSSVNASNTTTPYVAVWETLSSTATVEELLTQAAGISNEAIVAVAQATEVLWANDFGALAWVLNTETGGLSTYDNFGFSSIAVHDGVVYATSPEGVFALTADKDQNRNVEAELQTGMMDFEIPTTKRISDVFVGYTGGQLEYSVETYDGADGEVYSYEMPERDAAAPRNNRVKPGRGLSSRYWRFTVKNIDGADFQLHDQTAIIGASNRRL